MGDQLRWWKLWETALFDEKLAALSMEDCWRWAVLGVLLRVHGDGGVATWSRRGGALVTAWRTTPQRVAGIAQRLPGLDVTVTDSTITIRMRHWHKYQEDSSAIRTRSWRERARARDGQPTVTSHVTRDGQPASLETVQTRRDETIPPIIPPSPSVTGPAGQRLYPPGLFHRDCPDSKWLKHCVDLAYLAAHPDYREYPALDAQGTPRQCPAHTVSAT